MEIIFLGFGVSVWLAIVLSPSTSHLLMELREAKKKRVPSTYWGTYTEAQNAVQDAARESIELPDLGRKPVVPIGGTAYANGRAFNN
jgi:hypothetical protein